MKASNHQRPKHRLLSIVPFIDVRIQCTTTFLLLVVTVNSTMQQTLVNQINSSSKPNIVISHENESNIDANMVVVVTQSSQSQQSQQQPQSSITLNSATVSPRVYLQMGNLQDVPVKNQSYKTYSEVMQPPSTTGQVQTTVQIYIIFFVGIMPAAIGAAVWWLQNVRHSCTNKHKQHCNNNNNNQDPESRLSHNLMKNDKVSIENLTQQIVKRTEKFPDESVGMLYGNSYRSRMIKSRRVYSMEVPRKCLEMIEILGEGNFGQVWKAKSNILSDKSVSSFVAVKTNKVNASIDQQEDLLKELDIMLQLGSHPNVVRLLGCCTENEPYYLVMEFIPHGKLLSYLRRHRSDGAYYLESGSEKTPNLGLTMQNNYVTYCNNNAYGYSEIIPQQKGQTNTPQPNLTPADLVQFAYQISKGMEFISSHGIIHRDLAARNILVDENNNCKIADFGLSRSIRDKEGDMYEMKHAGQMPIRWMSPEALSMGLFTTKSDVWAYGILLWEIVTLGSTPYMGMSAQEVINYIRQGNICSQPEHCSDKLYELMKSCWAYKCQERYSFTDIKHYLAKMLLETNQNKCDYIDLEHFNNSLYYFNTQGATDEKL